ncbi:MAG: Crp/Fnr family transcriptional regulator [Caldimicrobium sp.]|nr:Crp/Fnr family transcriptional regulator [Caldimicrobium sp.]MDW8182918.1 Crp/Fnr family transcriptional regulator [Caldimicrobium sp.]
MFHVEQQDALFAEIKETLSNNFFFQGLPNDLLHQIASIGVVKKYEKNELIFAEGDRAFGFFIVLEGLVKVYKISAKGKEHIIHIFGKGEVFAEIVLSSLSNYPANAQALTEVKLLFIERNRFLHLIQKNPTLALYMIGVFAHRLRELVKTIENLTLKEASERLLAYLWYLSDEGKRQTLVLEIGKSQLALLLGITPETLSRLFQRFKDEGLLSIKGKEIHITNPSKWRLLLH